MTNVFLLKSTVRNMKTRYKILIIITIIIFSILFVPPNIAAFSCNTLKNKDLHCHLVGMTFFGIPFQTSIYHWFEWNDPLPCGGVKAHPDKIYPCIGIVDYWGYPPRFSQFAELVDFEPDTLSKIEQSPKPGDKYYIEPERKAQLEAVELDLRNKIQQFHQKNPLSSFAVNLDHHTKEIIVIVENEQFNSEIEEMISQYPDDIPIVFSNGKIVLDDFSGWITGEDYCSEWCDQNELYSLGCDKPILQHLIKYSNLLDEEFDGVYGIEDIGLPDGISQEKFEECVDIIYEKRTSMELENEN